jgi:hypothetical protein
LNTFNTRFPQEVPYDEEISSIEEEISSRELRKIAVFGRNNAVMKINLTMRSNGKLQKSAKSMQ